jgi:hypothetical protein
MAGNETSNITRYDIVAVDRTTGRKKVVTSIEPIRGRYAAQAQAEKLQRTARDPNLSYVAERSSGRKPQALNTPEGLLTHKFRVR